ncbi:hypothetical protein Lser_V15G11071 [Lactuca serriola]
MISSAMHNFLIFVLLTYAIAPITHACFMKKWHISVTNNISNGDFVAHIKSGNDDLGNHTIPFEGNYGWSFCDNFFGRTLFYGYFWWGSKFQTLDLFDNDVRKICALPKGGDEYCYWLVQANGFYVSAYSDGDWVFKKSWN